MSYHLWRTGTSTDNGGWLLTGDFGWFFRRCYQKICKYSDVDAMMAGTQIVNAAAEIPLRLYFLIVYMVYMFIDFDIYTLFQI